MMSALAEGPAHETRRNWNVAYLPDYQGRPSGTLAATQSVADVMAKGLMHITWRMAIA